ncbi:MAG: hypothetical protein LBP59_12620 [Planctomycetaceae bacterium]|nr:hypothetical protein [Planctomycetaceae bacterium]
MLAIIFVTKNRQKERRRLAYMWLYSTAGERVFLSQSLFVYLSANCRRGVCDPSDA